MGRVRRAGPDRSSSVFVVITFAPALFGALRCSSEVFGTFLAMSEVMQDKSKVKLSSPAFPDKSRLHSSGFRSKGFAITDLLGLESTSASSGGGEPHGGGGGGGCGGGGGGLGQSLGGAFSFPGASLPLGLGFLCGLAAQQPPGSAGGPPCFLPGHLPLLQRPDAHFMHGADPHRDAFSGTAPNTRTTDFPTSSLFGLLIVVVVV